MDGGDWAFPRSGTRARRRAALLALLLWLSFGAPVSADDVFTDDFEAVGKDALWALRVGQRNRVDVSAHRRQAKVKHAGKSAEELLLAGGDAGGEVAVVRATPPSRAHDAFTATLWVRSRTPGLRLGMAVTFPRQKHPATGQPLMAVISGEPATSSGKWEAITCGTDEASLLRAQAMVRASLSDMMSAKEIDLRGAYVDRLALLIPTSPAGCEVQFDDLSVGPILAPETADEAVAQEVAVPQGAKLSWTDDRLLRNGRPFISRFLIYHGEPIELLRETRVNAVWLDGIDERAVVNALANEGLGIFATPPKPTEPDDDSDTSMTPFLDETAIVDCWVLGRLETRDLRKVAHWVDQVQDADRKFQRPLLGDVTGHLKHFQRELPLIGTSRRIPQTSTSPIEYLEFFELQRRQALPGRPLCTLIPTEPSPESLAVRRSSDIVPVVEPELIALCAHAALASGYKQLGFETDTSLASDAPGFEERRQMLKLINMEIELLEPWLATGKVIRTSAIRQGGKPANAGRTAQRQRGLNGLNPFLSVNDSTPSEAAADLNSPMRATVLRADAGLGLLILANWFEPNAQYQPGPMAMRDLTFVTSRFDDASQAWEVSTTGLRQIPLDLQPVPTGLEIPIARFNQHTAIVMTSDRNAISQLEKQTRAMREPAAKSWVALATAKLNRVEAVHLELQTLAPAMRGVTEWLNQAHLQLQQAEDALAGTHFDEARQYSQNSLQMTRAAQRAYWEQAVARLPSPQTSPHALCFQTLPDHWRLFNRLAKNPPVGENLLPSGSFEDRDAIASGWRCESAFRDESSEIRPSLGLFNPAAEGKLALHLVAEPARPNQQPIVEEPVISIISPPVSVYSGQLLRITGKVLVPGPITSGVDGLMVYDSLGGSAGAVRFRKPSAGGHWERFELYRDVKESGDLQVIFELRGLGRAMVDDVQVRAITLEEAAPPK